MLELYVDGYSMIIASFLIKVSKFIFYIFNGIVCFPILVVAVISWPLFVFYRNAQLLSTCHWTFIL